MNNIEIGNLGEQAAADYLCQAGYKLLAQKYRTKMGEIDIIALHQDTLVFVEVKTRRSTHCGFPAEAVTYRKRQKIINTALSYLTNTNQRTLYCRFDVIEIFLSGLTIINYNHIVNAFSK